MIVVGFGHFDFLSWVRSPTLSTINPIHVTIIAVDDTHSNSHIFPLILHHTLLILALALHHLIIIIHAPITNDNYAHYL